MNPYVPFPSCTEEQRRVTVHDKPEGGNSHHRHYRHGLRVHEAPSRFPGNSTHDKKQHDRIPKRGQDRS